MDPKVVEALVAENARSEESPLTQLTPREHDVLREMAEGKNNAAIAASLFLTERSVEKVIHSIFLKLGLTWEPAVHKRVKAVSSTWQRAPSFIARTEASRRRVTAPRLGLHRQPAAQRLDAVAGARSRLVERLAAMLDDLEDDRVPIVAHRDRRVRALAGTFEPSRQQK